MFESSFVAYWPVGLLPIQQKQRQVELRVAKPAAHNDSKLLATPFLRPPAFPTDRLHRSAGQEENLKQLWYRPVATSTLRQTGNNFGAYII
jgi:O-glycosyl hydrolase